MGKKGPTDPNAPKRPQSAFWMWMRTGVREAIMEQYSLWGDEQWIAVKICAKRWKELPLEEKAPFQEMAKLRLETYK